MSDADTSETRFGIVAQPPETCPLIDRALDEIRDMSKKIRGYERADESELRDMISYIEISLGELDGFQRTGLLEDIRRRVKDIRAWGQEWKNAAKELEDKRHD